MDAKVYISSLPFSFSSPFPVHSGGFSLDENTTPRIRIKSFPKRHEFLKHPSSPDTKMLLA